MLLGNRTESKVGSKDIAKLRLTRLRAVSPKSELTQSRTVSAELKMLYMSGRLTLEGTLAEAESKLRIGNVTEALSKADTLFRPFPDAVRVWRLYAQALEQQGEHARAVEAYERVLEIVPADLRAMSGLARSLQAVGRTQEAGLVAQQVLDYMPTDREMLSLAPRPALGGDSAVYRVALAHLRSGLSARAVSYLRSLVANHADRADLRLALATALWRNQEHIAAVEQCWVVLSELPDCLLGHVLLFDIWRSACAVSLERMHLAHIERLDPDHRETAALFELNAPLSTREVLIQRPNGAHPHAQAEANQLSARVLADLLQAAQSTPSRPPTPVGSPESASFIVSEWSRAEDLSEASSAVQASFLDVVSSEDEIVFTAPRLPITPEPGDDLPSKLEPLTWTPSEETSKPIPQPATSKPVSKSRARSERSARASTPKNALEREVLSAAGAALDALIERLERAAATTPTPQVLEALGLAYTRRGNLEAALSAYQRALVKPK